MEINPALLGDCRRGDRRAQFELYRRCFDLLMGVCRRYATDDAHAAELLNLGFLKILNNLGKYRPEAPFEAWIRRVMINVIIDDFRSKQRAAGRMREQELTAAPVSELPVDWNEAELRFDAEALEQMIRTLPPTSGKVFNLFAVDGYTHNEIGRMLGISEGTSKWHLAHARRCIQERLQEQITKVKPISHGHG